VLILLVSPATTHAAGAACVVPAATVYYPWDGNTNDASGNGYNLISGALTGYSIDAISNQSAVMNGTSDYLNYANGNFLNKNITNMAVVLWIKPARLTGIQTIYEEGGDLLRGAAIRLNNGLLEAAVSNGTSFTVSAPYPTDGDWHMITLIYDNGTVTLYIDDVAVAGPVASGVPNVKPHVDAGGFGATIGLDVFGSVTLPAGNYFQGQLEEAIYYQGSIITFPQTQAIYNCMRPLYDYGDAPDGYQTLAASLGARHSINVPLYLGSVQPDNELDGIPGAAADGDDLSALPDDEDGVAAFAPLLDTATAYSVSVVANNTSGAAASLTGWIDFNRNGSFEPLEGASAVVPAGTVNGTVVLNWSGLSGLVPGTSYARFRLTTDTAITTATPGGAAYNGEVEDYTLTILPAPPLLTVLKQASSGTAPTGGNIIYTVTVANTGTGAASNVVVSDTMSSYAKLALDPFANGSIYSFTDGANPSGLPGTGVVTYSCAGSPFAAPTPACGADDGSGHAINVDAFRITMDGVMSANTAANPNFQIQYQIQVK